MSHTPEYYEERRRKTGKVIIFLIFLIFVFVGVYLLAVLIERAA